MRKHWLKMCSQIVCAKTDDYLMNTTSEILLPIRRTSTPADSEAQLIAEAIQENNAKRANELSLEPLEMQVISGIIMVGALPRF
jgi:hypothetical protein